MDDGKNDYDSIAEGIGAAIFDLLTATYQHEYGEEIVSMSGRQLLCTLIDLQRLKRWVETLSVSHKAALDAGKE